MGSVRPIGEGSTYHLMARGNDRRRIFEDDEDRSCLLGLMDVVATHRAWVGYAYCLMENHLHFVVTTPRADVGDGMRDLLSRYARRFNRRHGRSGHLFSERYRLVLVQDDAQLLATIRYVARNPTRAGITASPEDWPWGSYPALASGRAPAKCISREAVLALFHPVADTARGLLAHFVEDRVDVDERPREPVSAARMPHIRSLIQLLGTRQAIQVAADLGCSGAQIAAALDPTPDQGAPAHGDDPAGPTLNDLGLVRPQDELLSARDGTKANRNC